MPGRSLWMLAALSLLGSAGCGGTEAVPDAADSPGRTKAPLSAYFPTGFIRVAANGSTVAQFDNTSGTTVTVSHKSGSSNYLVSFPGLASSTNPGHVQVSAEGTGNARCRATSWTVSGGTEQVGVDCNVPGTGAGTEAAFAVLYFRYQQPGSISGYADTAYAYVTSAGSLPTSSSYNASGAANTVSHPSTGSYTVTFPNALYENASLMVSAYGGSGAPFCQIGGSTTSTTTPVSTAVNVLCWDSSGSAADSAFFLSYATTGPSFEQQSGHGRFTGGALVAANSAALGNYVNCSFADVSASLTGTTASVQVRGEMFPWNGTTLYRASFVSGFGTTPTYCRTTAINVTSNPAMPPNTPATTTGTTQVQCQDGTGSGKGFTPSFTITHTTSDSAAPC